MKQGACSALGEGLHVCGYVRCGRAFATPVRLTDFSQRPRLETYFACPYCFSKLNEAEAAEMSGFSGEMRLLHGGGYEVSVGEGVKKSLKSGVQKGSDRVVSCPHSLGYLKTRAKDEEFPDGCLTCPRILQCMV